MIRAKIFSTDGEIQEVSGLVHTFKNEEEFKIAKEELSLYDDGASHYYLELDSPTLIGERVKLAWRDSLSMVDLGVATTKILAEAELYSASKILKSDEN